MKLLIITNLFPNSKEPTRGMFNRQQFIELAKLCEIKVVAPIPWHHFSPVPREETIDSIEVYHPRLFFIPKLGRFLYGILFYLGIKGLTKRIYKSFQFNCILATWVYPDGYGSYLLSKAMKKPIMIKAHGSDINVYAKTCLRGKMIARILKDCGKAIAVSNALKEKMLEMGVPEEKIAVIHNGVDINLFKPMDAKDCRRSFGLPLESKIILYVGNFAQGKGIEDLIEAFAKISARDANCLLVLAGDGKLKLQLQQLAARNDNGEKVRFVDRQAHEKIAVLMNACDIFCLPSLNEGCPNVVLEALACAKPVVATNVGGIPEIITTGDLGILVEPRNSAALAEAIIAGLNKKWDAQKIREYVSGYSWKENAEKLNEILIKIASPRLGGARNDNDETTPRNDSIFINLKKVLKSAIILFTPERLILWRRKAGTNKIALTFDDGPNARFTPAILEILKEKNVKATFFVLGSEIEKNSQIAEKIIHAGHCIGNHSYSHRRLNGLKSSEKNYEIQKPREIFAEKLGLDARLFRPPQGKMSIPQLIYCAKNKITTVLWSIDSCDFRDRDSQAIVNRVIGNGIKGGDIVLLHDDNEFTLKALPEIIDRLKDKGLEFATVEEILL